MIDPLFIGVGYVAFEVAEHTVIPVLGYKAYRKLRPNSLTPKEYRFYRKSLKTLRKAR